MADEINPYIVSMQAGHVTTRITLNNPAITVDVPLHSIKCLFADQYEGLETRLIGMFYGQDKGDRVLEAGGGIGWTSSLIAQRVEHITVFEPLPEFVPLIQHNLELNRVTNYTIRQGALGAGTGKREFACRDLPYASSLAGMGKDSIKEEFEVDVFDINEVIKETRANCVQLDVEGAEAEIITRLDFTPLYKFAVEMHPHILGEDVCSGLIQLVNAQGLFPLIINGWKQFPNQCYVIGFARAGAFRDRILAVGFRDAGTITLTGLGEDEFRTA